MAILQRTILSILHGSTIDGFICTMFTMDSLSLPDETTTNGFTCTTLEISGKLTSINLHNLHSLITEHHTRCKKINKLLINHSIAKKITYHFSYLLK